MFLKSSQFVDYFELEAVLTFLFPPFLPLFLLHLFFTILPFIPPTFLCSPFFLHIGQHFILFYQGTLPNSFAPSLTGFKRTKWVMPLASVAVLYDLADFVRQRLRSWQIAVLKSPLRDLVALWRLVYTSWVCQHLLHSPPCCKDCLKDLWKGGKVCQIFMTELSHWKFYTPSHIWYK